MKELYTYDEVTKEYIGLEEQYIDPLETKLAGKDVYVKITNGTPKKPIVVKPFTANVFKSNKWVLVADYRGVKMFYIATKKEVFFKLGDKPSDKMTSEDPTLFTKPVWNLDAKKWEEEATNEEIIEDLKERLEEQKDA